MIRQSDNLARAAREVAARLQHPHDLTPDAVAANGLALDTALTAYDAARLDTLRLIEPAALHDADGFTYYAVRARGDIRGPLVTVRCQYHDGTDEPRLAAAMLARRIAASVNLLAGVPLDTLERLDTMSDAPAVLAAKVRGMLA